MAAERRRAGLARCEQRGRRPVAPLSRTRRTHNSCAEPTWENSRDHRCALASPLFDYDNIFNRPLWSLTGHRVVTDER